jgi:penicillin V acylase-like amidase (Ntn superfamily)
MVSRFASVGEVRSALPSVTVAPVYIDDGQPSPTAHWRVIDAAGGSIQLRERPSGHGRRAHDRRATTPPLATADDAVAHAFHILHKFDIPIGVELGEDERGEISDLPSATQWTAASDLSDRRFFDTTMHDSAVKLVGLNRLEFEQPGRRTEPPPGGVVRWGRRRSGGRA